MPSIEQEIEWCREEISCDEIVMDSSDASSFHRQRLEETKARLQELLELQPTTKLNK